jgi:hypothetical protein
MQGDEEYAVTNSVDVNLSCSALEGLVGGPVTFKIKIDANKVAKPKRVGDDSICLLYNVVADKTDWIVREKKVEGCLECSMTKNFTVNVVGIPVHPGVLKEFPALLVQYKSEQEDATPMTVHLRHSDYLNSLSFVNHTALASAHSCSWTKANAIATMC